MIKHLVIFLDKLVLNVKSVAKYVLLTFICMMCSLSSSATSPLISYPFSSPLFEKIDHDNNIVNDIVTIGLEAKNGIIWLGTQNGLVSFDGYQFTTYIHSATDEHSLPGNFIVGIGEQRDGNIWVATRSAGLAKFDITSRKFTTFDNEQSERKITSNTLRALYIASDDSIWIGSDSGIEHLSKEGLRINHFELPKNQKGIAYTIFEDENKSIFVGGTFGVARINKTDLTLLPNLSHLNVRGFVKDKDGTFWLSTHKGIYLWDGAENISIPQGVDPQNNQAYFRRIEITKQGQVWGATYGSGLWLFDEQTKSLQRKFQKIPLIAVA